MNNIKKFLNLKTVLILAAVIGVYLIPGNSSRLTQSILCMVCCYAALGLSWNVISGLCGMFSVTHAIFYGVGIYSVICSVARFNLHPIVGVIVGLALNVLLALLIGKIGSKLSSLYFTMALIGVSNALYTLSIQMNWLTGSTYGIALGTKYSITRLEACYVGITMVILFALFFVFLRKSRMGTSMVALKNNPDLCMALGSNIGKWRIYACIISAVMASLVGVYYAFYQKTVTPDVFAGTISLKILVVCIVGGIGSVWGPIFGSILIILDEWIRGAMPTDLAPLASVVYALIMIITLKIRPGGLISIKLPTFKAKAKSETAPKA